jgi:RNA polymerase sigma-70 factor (family 1)
MTTLQAIQSPDEITLLRQVAMGDEAAFTKLMQEYTNLLASHIFRLTHHREQTEEIVQDVFLKIWQTRESLAEIKNFRTYLYVISRNQALNSLRSMIRERNRHKQWEQVALTTVDEDDKNEKEKHFSLLEEAITQLPAQQQRAWLLSRREGLKHREIAKEMELSEETVKKYIQYASQSITCYVETHVGITLLGIIASLN